ncbi:MAG: hypothetical protein Q7W51_02390 [Coriobacteriia bacterium]|nr:hypothetical protein [Coriobacteriia bacterium]
MRVKRILGVLLIVLVVAAALAGCTDETTPDESGTTGTEAEPNEQPAGEWASTLPMEPGYAWDIAMYPGGGTLPVALPVAGPWTLEAGADWAVSTTEIVDPADVDGIDAFTDYDYVVKASDATATYFYPRQVTGEWMLQLGKITLTGDQATAEPYANPLKFWPVDFEVGETFVVSDTGSFGINATVLAKSAVTTPAGTIDEAYLVRFDYTPLAEGAMEGTQYYILSPEVGFVALFSVAAGDEATGFTALDSAQVLVTMPEKR